MAKVVVQFNEELIRARLRVAVVEAMNAMLMVTAVGMRAQLSKPGTGRIYRVNHGKKNGRNLRARGMHRASAPFRPPAVDTNRLRSSWMLSGPATLGTKRLTAGGFVDLRQEDQGIRMFFGSTVRYARALEYGRPKMKPRPYLRPVVEKALPYMTAIFERTMEKHFGKDAR